jgi:membrane carboxypeptidase/penicillin-binding protein
MAAQALHLGRGGERHAGPYQRPRGAQQGGLVVRTTLDLGLQQSADQAVKNGVKDLSFANINNSALLAADPRTGEVLAWVGSADYGNDKIAGQFDVVLAERQPGSSFKPYVYEAALRDHKITLATMLNDTPTDFNGYRPNDFDNGAMGRMTVRRALIMSRNIRGAGGPDGGMQNVIGLPIRWASRAHWILGWRPPSAAATSRSISTSRATRSSRARVSAWT